MTPDPQRKTLSYSEIRGNAKGSSLWTDRVSVPIASGMVMGFLRLGVTPDAVTVMSAVMTVGGALVALLSGGTLWGAVLFLVMTQIGYSLDGADGILARAQGTSSKFGAWFDLTLDRMVHAAVLCILMFVGMPEGGSASDILRHAAPWIALLVVSLGYHNGTNLRTVIFPRGKGGKEKTLVFDEGSAGSVIKGLVTASCDFGFFMFVLAVGMLFGVLQWAAWLTLLFHTVGLVALGVRVRQLSSAEARRGDADG